MSLCEIFCSIVESRTSSPHSRGENGREGGALSLHCGAPTPQLMETGKGEIRDSLAKRGGGDPGGQKIRQVF